MPSPERAKLTSPCERRCIGLRAAWFRPFKAAIHWAEGSQGTALGKVLMKIKALTVH